jgi:hypothetical protein
LFRFRFIWRRNERVLYYVAERRVWFCSPNHFVLKREPVGPPWFLRLDNWRTLWLFRRWRGFRLDFRWLDDWRGFWLVISAVKHAFGR